MRTETRKIYTAAELKKRKDQSAFEKAFETYLKGQAEDGRPDWSGEMGDSFTAVFKAAGVRLRDYNIGYPGTFARVEFPGNDGMDADAGDLNGGRALAWLENNLFGPLRVPAISLKDARAAQKERAVIYEKKRAPGITKDEREMLQRQADRLGRAISRLYNKPGELPSCPLTGVCFDDDFLDALRKDIAAGDTLKEAFEGLAHVYNKLLEAENDSQRTEEYFLDTASANEWEYTTEGKKI